MRSGGYPVDNSKHITGLKYRAILSAKCFTLRADDTYHSSHGKVFNSYLTSVSYLFTTSDPGHFVAESSRCI